MEEDKKQRRNFLKVALAVVAATGFTYFTGKKSKKTEGKKVKMLTPDGKLVEVDESIINKAGEGQRASNKEVRAWMKTSKIN